MNEEKELEAIKIAEIITRQLSGKVTAEQETFLNNWRVQSEINAQILMELSDDPESIRKELLNRIRQYDAPAAFERVNVRIANTGDSSFGVVQSRTKIKRLVRYISAAAAVLVLTLGYFNRDILTNWIDPVTYKELATLNGERKIITLPDGTKIWLSPASKIKYPDEFRNNEREITLTGEAFFEVSHDIEHPFIVHAGSVNTRVLGTSFTIQAYPEIEETIVTLLIGKVAVTAEEENNRQDQVELIPNQRAVFDKANNSITTEDYPGASELLNRRNGLYSYEGTPVPEIIRDMQREYSATLKIEGNLANCLFYGKKKQEDDVLKFLRKVCTAINAQLRTDGTTIIITGKGC